MNKKVTQQKKSIRQQVRLLRNQISNEQARLAAESLPLRLKVHTNYAEAKRVACFISFDGEINTQPLIDMILRDKGVCFLPKLRPNKPNRLWFMPYTANSQLVNNQYGIPEVDLAVNHALAVSDLELLLIPLVAFDTQGNRLGMGGGFYDATLAHFTSPTKLTQQRPNCVGIAFELQKVTQIPSQRWDVPLDGILTPEHFYHVAKSWT